MRKERRTYGEIYSQCRKKSILIAELPDGTVYKMIIDFSVEELVESYPVSMHYVEGRGYFFEIVEESFVDLVEDYAKGLGPLDVEKIESFKKFINYPFEHIFFSDFIPALDAGLMHPYEVERNMYLGAEVCLPPPE